MALLINAVDAMDEQGTITHPHASGRGDARGVVAEVVDQGEGIRAPTLPKIFEPFFTTKAPGRGTGLGLSICYAIIADHGGRIEVDSTPGAGSAFRIVLAGRGGHVMTAPTTGPRIKVLDRRGRGAPRHDSRAIPARARLPGAHVTRDGRPRSARCAAKRTTSRCSTS